MSLDDWCQNGWLVRHDSDRSEIAELFAVIDRDLHDSQAQGLSPDWRFNIAYNAALQSAVAALAAAGYRAARDAHHFRVIQSLSLTVKLDQKQIDTLDAFRKKRNLLGYERVGAVSDKEAKDVLDLARMLRREVERWIREKHSSLLPER